MPTATNVGLVYRRLNDDGTHVPVSREEVSESGDDIYEVAICGFSYAVRATVFQTQAPRAAMPPSQNRRLMCPPHTRALRLS